MRQLVLLSLTLCLWARQDLPDLEAKLYAYIQQTQIKEHPLPRYIGTWPSYPKYSGVRKEIPESNSFMTLQTLIYLDAVAEDFHLPEVDKIYALANKQIDKYVEDGKRTQEAEGTISFWPLIQTEDGRLIRSFDTQWYNTSMRILNLGNDFDTSAHAFTWFYQSNKHREFLDAFVHSLAKYTDHNRTVEHPLNTQCQRRS